MAVDLEVQIRDYAVFLREAAAIDAMTVLDTTESAMPPLRPARRRRPVLVALVAAVIVLLVIGGVGLLVNLITDEPPVVDDPTPTSVPGVESLGGGEGVIDSTGDVGFQPVMIVGGNGNPIIAYVDQSRGVVKLATCTDPTCGDVTVITLGQWGGAINHTPTITVGSDKAPLITFGTEDDLLVYKCSDQVCSEGSLSSIAGGGQDPMVAIAPDGLPFIAFSSFNGDLVGLKCGNLACSEGNILTNLVVRENQGLGLNAGWVAFTVESLPVVGYEKEDETGVVACHDPACSSHDLLPDTGSIVLDTTSVVGSMVVGPSGQALLAAFVESGAGDLSLVVTACDDPVCSSGTTMQIGQVVNGDGIFEPTLLYDAQGLPMVFYADRNQLIRAQCSDQNCTGQVDLDVLIQQGGTFLDATLALGADGNPVIAYYANSDLHFVACIDSSCADLVSAPPIGGTGSSSDLWVTKTVSDSEVATADFNPPYALDSQGRLIIAYVEHIGGETEESFNEIRLVRCVDPICTETAASSLEVNAGSVGLTTDRADRVTMVHLDYSETVTIAVTHCSDADCSTYVTNDLAETGSWPNPGIVSSLGSDAMVFYQDWNDFYPRLIRCDGEECNRSDIESQIKLFETSDGFRYLMNSFVARTAPDGLPLLLVVQGKEEGNAEVWYARCADATCTDADTVLLDNELLDADTGSFVVGGDDLPLIAYYADGSLMVVKCHDVSCSDHTMTAVGPAIADFIASVTPSIAVAPNGLPVIAYWNPERHVVLAVCEDDGCSRSTLVDFGDVGSHTLAFGLDGLPFLLYHESGDLKLAMCQNPACLQK